MTDQIDRNAAAGLEDVIRSVRVLARQARELVEQAGGVAERELAMVLTVAEDARDRLLAAESLAKNRQRPIFRQMRDNTHRAVDLGFDAVVTVYALVTETVENFLDQPRETKAASTTAKH